MTVTINLEPIKDRQPIDAIGVGDFLLVGDASDDGKVKPAMIGGLDFAPDKLAIANYDWLTIPSKPTDLAPDKLAIANYDWSTIPNKPTFETVDLTKIISSTLPASRVNGQPFNLLDKWENPTSGLIGTWNGSFFVSPLLIHSQAVVNSITQSNISGLFANPKQSLNSLIIDFFTIVCRNNGTLTNINNWTATLYAGNWANQYIQTIVSRPFFPYQNGTSWGFTVENVNQVVLKASPSTRDLFSLLLEKSGSAGSIFGYGVSVGYRLILE